MIKTDSLVAINITKRNSDQNNISIELLNPSNVPLLFYWNGDGEIKNYFINDDKLRNHIALNTFNVNNYTHTSICYFYFTYDENGNEKYLEDYCNIQDLFSFNSMNNDEAIFFYDYLIKYFNTLYQKAFKLDYTPEMTFDVDGMIRDMFDQIQKKYPSKFSKETLFNYIRHQLKNDNMTSNNIDFILEKLDVILNA